MNRRPERRGRRRLTDPFTRGGGAVALSLSFLLCTPFGALPTAAQTETPGPSAVSARPLTPGVVVEGSLSSKTPSAYSLKLDAGEAAVLEIERIFADPALSLTFPDGTHIKEMGVRGFRTGPMRLVVVAPVAGDYRLQINRKSISVPESAFKLVWKERRKATDSDQALFDAERLLTEAEAKAKTRTPEGKRLTFEKFDAALGKARSAGDRDWEGGILFRTGFTRINVNEYPKALETFQQALPVLREARNRAGEAATLGHIGVSYAYLNDRPKAIEFYEQAVTAWRAIGDREGEGAVLSDLAPAYSALGQKLKALEIYQRAVLTLRAIGDESREAWALNNMATVYSQVGEPQLALDALRLALPLGRSAGDKSMEALTLGNTGREYYNLGENEKALDFLQQAIALWTEADDKGGQANGIANLGTMRLSTGKPKEASEAFARAIDLFRAVADKRGEAQTMANLGNAYSEMGDHAKATATLEDAVTRLRAIDQRAYGNAVTQLAKAHAAAGNREKAVTTFQQALTVHRAVGYKTGEADTLYFMAKLEADRGNLEESRKLIDESVSVLEQIRSNVASQSLRATFLATKRRFYDLQTDILMRLHQSQPSKGFDGEAFQVSERIRARGLLELLRESRADIRNGVDPQLLERERTLQQKINTRADALVRLKANPATAEQAKAAEVEVNALLEEFERTQTEIRKVSPRYAALTQPKTLSLAEAKGLLDPNTVLLEYGLGETRGYLWLVTADGLKSFTLPGQKELEKLARRAYEGLAVRGQAAKFDTRGKHQAAIVAGEREFAEVSKELSRILLGPAAADLVGKRVLVVADGALLYLPFAALPDPSSPDQPLVANHEVIALPSLAVLRSLREESANRPPAEYALAILADPVFDRLDRRVKSAKPLTGTAESRSASREIGLQLSQSQLAQAAKATGIAETGDELVIRRIPFTRNEAKAIRKYVDKPDATVALDFEASRDFALGPELARYRIVHFATHGILDTTRPELSGLVLSLVNDKGEPRDGFLRMTDVYNLKMPAELVVLSACQTGLGREMRGEGLVGLTRGFFYAGARRVVVSYWSVNDEATAELMTHFYRAMLREHASPAAALRTAQKEMLRSKRFSAPYYWAAFNIQGDWR